ncbi:MAG: DegV family protein [Caldicoprobacterales bacterium]|jgi:DegV family protein with EDD domain|nr:DegV family protein [Clostridiales bacterium]
MSMRIVADSCCDVSPEVEKQTGIELVPLTIQIGDKEYRDDKNLDIDGLIEDMKNSPIAPKTACPSPQDFIESYKGDGSVFVVTLSSALSGTYRSAMMAKDIFLEEVENKFIHVFDSLSASVGETLVSLHISELINKGLKEMEIVEKVNAYIKDMRTFFTLKSLDNLVKSGRVSHFVAKVSSILSVKPIMAENGEGQIEVHEKVVGAKRVFKRLVEVIGEQGQNLEDKVLGIAHCNALESALAFKEEVLKRYNFKDIVIVRTGGISSVYANEGGLIIAF